MEASPEGFSCSSMPIGPIASQPNIRGSTDSRAGHSGGPLATQHGARSDRAGAAAQLHHGCRERTLPTALGGGVKLRLLGWWNLGSQGDCMYTMIYKYTHIRVAFCTHDMIRHCTIHYGYFLDYVNLYNSLRTHLFAQKSKFTNH